MGIKQQIKKFLVGKQNKRYSRLHGRYQMTYAKWLEGMEKEWSRDWLKNKKRYDNSDFIIVYPGKGSFPEYAKANIQQYFEEYPGAMAVYWDEDMPCEDGENREPVFKPDWSPNTLDSYCYIGYDIAVRSELAANLQKVEQGMARISENFATSAEYFEWLHAILQPAFDKRGEFVGHIPQVLYHAEDRTYNESNRKKENTVVEKRNPDALPKVAVIIPSKDHPQVLKACVKALFSTADCPFELIVVDNGSSEENRALTEEMLDEEFEQYNVKGQNYLCGYRYYYEQQEFNFSVMCNLGVKNSTANYLLFLNDDVVLTEPVLARMLSTAEKSYVGAVGIKLLYPDTEKIQHAGITNLPMGPVHKLQFEQNVAGFYSSYSRDCMAVTAACLMVSRDKYTQVGGFCEDLKVAFNDVDFCFKLFEQGFFNVCMNELSAWHCESLSRGDDESEEKLERLLAERDKLYSMHSRLEGYDPFFSDHYQKDCLDTKIRPLYETGNNRVQNDVRVRTRDASQYRSDPCLMVRVESYIQGCITGYGVVLGDNNACYKKELVLMPEGVERVGSSSRQIFTIPVREQLRPDLEENMADQVNVGLSGYRVNLTQAKLPGGKYRVGMLVKNKVTGLKLLNMTNRFIDLG